MPGTVHIELDNQYGIEKVSNGESILYPKSNAEPLDGFQQGEWHNHDCILERSLWKIGCKSEIRKTGENSFVVALQMRNKVLSTRN